MEEVKVDLVSTASNTKGVTNGRSEGGFSVCCQ